MNVTVKQLKAFVAVARSGSFAQACAGMHLSQPALSITIRNLEQAIGGSLFARSTRSMVLTPEGEGFLPLAERLLRDWDGALGDLHDRFALRRGKLVIAAMPSFASSLLPEMLLAFHRLYPAIKVSVQDVVAESVVAMVREGRAELGLSFDPGNSGDLHFQPLFHDHFVAVLPPQHALLAMSSLRWKNLEPYPFIALQQPSSIREQIDEFARAEALQISVLMESHQLATIGRMVSAGLGLSVVPALCSGPMQEMGNVCRTLDGANIARDVGILTRRGYPLSAAAAALQKMITAKEAAEAT
jgi:LysR family transcriptional regulator, carnitine catabolism transcriptional activator